MSEYSDQHTRNQTISLRLTVNELKAIDALRDKLNKTKRNYWDRMSSRSDAIILAIKFANGDLEAAVTLNPAPKESV